MEIRTKYDIGHTFWVPRCHIEYETETLVFEDNEWTRDVQKYVGYAKQKFVKKIVATTSSNDRVHIQYYVLNIGEENAMSQVYSEADITNRTEEEAYALAMEYQAKEEEYFGN
jgi:hypothetical protein